MPNENKSLRVHENTCNNGGKNAAFGKNDAHSHTQTQASRYKINLNNKPIKHNYEHINHGLFFSFVCALYSNSM